MLNKLLNRWAEKLMASREPDFLIGADKDPIYIRRWWVIPRNPFFNIYLHEVGQDDDDRALHDHPWLNMSYIISGGYNEITPTKTYWPLRQGCIRFRRPTAAHRLELLDSRTVSLFITGPRVRKWGFHCPQGWVHWKDFISMKEGGISNVGRGCGD